ncbi:pyrimidine (deoxy)nucleoside triphosphate diphosphatase [Hafnia psychrotolerans]|uniref:Pyrimidine (Deoxy)nucleoside triphosphate pyrophosphohydrolase n=1 Tax=Hafnia psychrotolerans TaxID=1477018 RepID=A0ABQ1GRK1_9GAMM|nr:pyrimidine (deoxy)nucleoside triphosphate diphosphatase [Hafnia psychrotolerans]GGA48562.1 pyrimidine (deoxy)nucleoside triphosphate pyrophosphohydrolase [Hafnia psychrotolerans]
MKVIDVVAAIIEQDGNILLARRDASGDQAGLWEFPGGKVEDGESQPQALIRELQEELGITAQVEEWITSHDFQQPTRIIRLHAWRVSGFTDSITLRCHSEIVWTLPHEAGEYDLAPADVPLLAAYCQKRAR